MNTMNILLNAKTDAMMYEEGKATFDVVPPFRYSEDSAQSTYANFFWSFLRELRGESVLFEGTKSKELA
jgi:hypothetical protein